MRVRKTFGLAMGLAAMASTGCDDVISLDPVDERPVVQPRSRPAPIVGGTLLVSGDLAIAADPDRDTVHVVDLQDERVLHTIAMEPGDRPARLARGDEHRVHVVLRGFGGIATIDQVEGTVLRRTRVCAEPRGITFDELDSSLWVACAGGMLVNLDEAEGTELSRSFLQADLRDVMMVDGEPKVSTFRSATVIDEAFRVISIGTLGVAKPRVAWKTWATSSGTIYMLHQLASTQPVPIEPPPEDMGPDRDLPYGGGSFCEPGISAVAFTSIDEGIVSTTVVPGASLTVDAAVDPTGDWLALAMPGAPEGQPTFTVLFREGHGCFLDDNGQSDVQVTSVAFHANSTLVAQSREPAQLLVQSELPFGDVRTIDLPGESRYDTGHEIFHRATDSGLSCASCHPEGTDDGHVWVFENLGKRRTQPLDVGLAGTAPFHWDGDMEDMSILMEEVLGHRMGGKIQSAPRRDSFESWVFELEGPPADMGLENPSLVAEGEALFAAMACDSCHYGDKLGGLTTEEVRGVPLQVPSLVRVSLRPPFMHDGRSATLEASVIDMIESTTTIPVQSEDVTALTAYLRTL